MYGRQPREFWEDSQDSLKQPPTSMWYPIKAGKMGKPHKKSVPQSGSREFWEHSRKSLKEMVTAVFVMELTVSKG